VPGAGVSLTGPASSMLSNSAVLHLSSLVPSEVRRRQSERLPRGAASETEIAVPRHGKTFETCECCVREPFCRYLTNLIGSSAGAL
jgi:hypothetical protein